MQPARDLSRAARHRCHGLAAVVLVAQLCQLGTSRARNLGGADIRREAWLTYHADVHDQRLHAIALDLVA